MNELLLHGKKALASQPFSVLLGAELHEFDVGRAEIRIPIKHELLQHNGFVHGGVISYAADNTLTFAGGSSLGLGSPIVTAEYKINYLRPAVGEMLIARATTLNAGKSQAVVRCDVYIVAKCEEKLCATALGTIARLPARNE